MSRRALATIVLLVLLLANASAEFVAAQDAATPAIQQWQITPPFAWNREDRYQPPDFEAFFPDDVEGGRQLDRFLQRELTLPDVEQRLALIRRGLRNTTHYATTLLGNVGNEFIWNRAEQDPRAIELMYHASASPDGALASYALYHGPTVVSERTPNLVRMLMERYQDMDAGMQQRIVWGMNTYGDKEKTRALLLGLLDEHASLTPGTIGAAVDTYRGVFNADPPQIDRFDDVGQWVIAFSRDDVSAEHPRAAELLRKTLESPLRGRETMLIDFVTRVDGKLEVGVALVRGLKLRSDIVKHLATHIHVHVILNEMLSPRTLRTCRLRAFARHLPQGLPDDALPAYTRPPADATYAHQAATYVPPDFYAFFADDVTAGTELDRAYAEWRGLTLSDGELLDLFRRGMRRSSQSPNIMFGWIAGALGWPPDPRLTEIFYQAIDSRAPLEVRQAGIYYGFGLRTEKTQNMLEAMYHVYMTPPFDRSTSREMRSRILWGVRDHEGDKHFLATRFAAVLETHAALSDEALQQADLAYRELTDNAPPNADQYASRGTYLVAYHQDGWKSQDEARQQMAERLKPDAPQLIESTFFEHDGAVLGLAIVRGRSGMEWALGELQKEPELRILFADLLTRDVIERDEGEMLRGLEKYLPEQR